MEFRPAVRTALLILLGIYFVALAVALLAPSSHDQSAMASWLRMLGRSAGLTRFQATQARAEFVGNVIIVAPVSALGSLVWRSTSWRWWTAYTFVFACGVESAQGLLLPGRVASTVDVVANTMGGLLGAVFVALCAMLLRSGGRVERATPAERSAADGQQAPRLR